MFYLKTKLKIEKPNKASALSKFHGNKDGQKNIFPPPSLKVHDVLGHKLPPLPPQIHRQQYDAK